MLAPPCSLRHERFSCPHSGQPSMPGSEASVVQTTGSGPVVEPTDDAPVVETTASGPFVDPLDDKPVVQTTTGAKWRNNRLMLKRTAALLLNEPQKKKAWKQQPVCPTVSCHVETGMSFGGRDTGDMPPAFWSPAVFTVQKQCSATVNRDASSTRTKRTNGRSS